MKLAIVGAEEAKFTAAGRLAARALIIRLLSELRVSLVVSGGCHLGGIDVWAEELAGAYGIPTLIHRPKAHLWSTGYRPRNLAIARDCDELVNIVVSRYPPEFRGMIFDNCYHCRGTNGKHVKSGGCWTALRTREMGKPARWEVVEQ